jgi:hypothetical protein
MAETSPVSAQSYSSPAYSGGTHYAPGPNGFGNLGDGPVQGGGWGGGSGGTNSATCSGAIQTIFTWSAPDGTLPPKSVIITETSSATASGASYPASTVGGSCDDGIGQSSGSLTQTPIMSGTTQIGTSGAKTCQGTRYSVMSGGQTVTLNCTPTASASATTTATSSVAYSASISPIALSIQLGGDTSVGGAEEALTGQQITATIIGSVPANCKVLSHTWGVTGGSPIQNYDPTAPNTTNTTQIVPISATDEAAPTFQFYDPEAGTDSVTCTVTIQFPDNTTGTLSLTPKPIVFMKPTATWKAYEGYPQGFTYQGLQQGEVAIGMFEAPGSGYLAGMAWPPSGVSITVPSGFSGTGSACVAQLYKPNRTYTEGKSQIAQPGWINGTQGLDGQFPYQNVSWNVPGGSPVANFGDSPYTGVPSGSNVDPNTGQVISSFMDNDSVSSWLMYKPPGTSIWVPLSEYDWSWAETVDGTGTGWEITSSTPAQNSSTATLSAGATSNYPSWTMIQTGGGS